MYRLRYSTLFSQSCSDRDHDLCQQALLHAQILNTKWVVWFMFNPKPAGPRGSPWLQPYPFQQVLKKKKTARATEQSCGSRRAGAAPMQFLIPCLRFRHTNLPQPSTLSLNHAGCPTNPSCTCSGIAEEDSISFGQSTTLITQAPPQLIQLFNRYKFCSGSQVVLPNWYHSALQPLFCA